MDRGHQSTEPDATTEWMADQSKAVDSAKIQLAGHYSANYAEIQGASIGGRSQ
jgi:hypothetical protein